MKVGALTLVTVLAGVLILRFIDKGTSNSGGYLVYVLMDDVSGIVKRSQVRVAGIPIGVVEDIRLENEQARVDIRVNPDVALYEDAEAGKTTRKLTRGILHFQLTPVRAGRRPVAKDGDPDRHR